jgi:hypothetical protein
MKCDTIRSGDECAFMTGEGCSYNGGTCLPVDERCEGCKRTKEYDGTAYCGSYPDPGKKWKFGACNFATHIKAEADGKKTKINPLKASKRAARAKRKK